MFLVYRNQGYRLNLYLVNKSIKSERLLAKLIFSEQFKKTVTCYKKTGHNIDILRQTACMVVNTVKTTLLPSLIVQQRVGPQTKWRLSPQSVSDG